MGHFGMLVDETRRERWGPEARGIGGRSGAEAGALCEGGRTDRPEGGGTAHVAEWRRVGAKRVLGDMGRGGGPCPRAIAAKRME